MDFFGITSIPSWIIVFAVIFYVCHWYMKRTHRVFESLGVPYRRQLPFISNWIEEFTSVSHQKDVDNCKKYGRVYGMSEFSQPSLRVSDPAIIKEVLVKQFNHFTDRRKFNIDFIDPAMRKMLSILRGEEWRMTRHVMSPAFTSGKLKQMVALVNKCSERFVEILTTTAEKEENVDAKGIYMSYLLEVVGTCAFGIEMNANNDTFVNYARRLLVMKRIFVIILIFLLPKKIRNAFGLAFMDQQAMKYITDTLRAIIKGRESGKERRNDFLQLMLDAASEADTKSTKTNEDDSENQEKRDIKAVLTPEGVLAQSFLFIAAGLETTATALSYISYAAATNQDCQDKLIDEIERVLSENNDEITWDTISQMTYMDMFILETLRMYPPAIRIDRHCSEETEIGDLHIPKDFTVTIPVYAIHHDEEFYPDPYRFDPERFTPEKKEKRNAYIYLPFGGGPRNCIGMRFAMMELKVTLVHLFKAFRIVPSPKTQIPLVYLRGRMQLMPTNGIHVKFIKR